MRTISVYHQCHKNKKATEFVIEQFRKHNPNIPYYLLSDAGDDFSEIAQKYNCHYEHGQQNIGLNYLPPQDLKILYERIRSCFFHFNTDYVLWMEDDVLCRGPIHISRDVNLAASYVPGNKLLLWDKIKKYNPNPNIDWFGATGGSILNKNIFINEDNVKKIYKSIDEDFEARGGTCDQAITMMYLICGYDCEINENLTETHLNPNWEETNIPLIHNYKKMYV